jgi:hypothetical protein
MTGVSPYVSLILVGNKCDLVDPGVSVKEPREYAESEGIPYFETSAKTCKGVNELVSMIGSIMLTKLMKLLWRGSRDGFKARTFHERCDGHRNTLTLIRDTKGNIFGGVTRIEWESSFLGKRKIDEKRESFIFTLRNPHGLPERKFSHKSVAGLPAIRVSSKMGPCFGDGDLFVSDNCNITPSSTSGFGRVYENETGIEGNVLLTGGRTFLVQEIEVFEFFLD